MTGYRDGLVSLRAAEANDDVRERVRVSMAEPYRTLLGHFRHEIGHFYFQQLVKGAMLEEARALLVMSARTTRQRFRRVTTLAHRPVARQLHFRIRKQSPVRGLCIMLGPSVSHRRHVGVDPIIRAVYRAVASSRPRGGGRFRPLSRRGCPAIGRCLGSDQPGSQHLPTIYGRARYLSVRSFTPGRRQTGFHQSARCRRASAGRRAWNWKPS